MKLEPISLKLSPDKDEAWVQAQISDDPTILGLGDLDFLDKERSQPSAGRHLDSGLNQIFIIISENFYLT